MMRVAREAWSVPGQNGERPLADSVAEESRNAKAPDFVKKTRASQSFD
jgi:hypothetical protein